MPAINANCKYLLHLDGADAATATTDSSGANKAVTFVNQAQLDTAQFKFGTASLLLDGTGDAITTPDHADFYLGTGAFTIDFWARWNALPADGSSQAICSQYVDAQNHWSIQLYRSGTAYGLSIANRVSNSLTVNIGQNTSPNITTNTWYHFAFTRSGNSWYIFQNGTLLGTATTNTNEISDFNAVFNIGTRTGEDGFNGWIDEFNLVKGTALYTSNFIPPKAPYGTADPTGAFLFNMI